MEYVAFEEGWFKNPENGLELSVQYDGTNIYITFFDLDQKPAGKKVIKVEDASLPEIQGLFDEYKRVD